MAKRYKIYDKQLNSFLYGKQSKLGREMGKRSRLMEAAAKRNVKDRTGQLGRSISSSHNVRVGAGQQIVLKATAPYARAVHEGTKPRLIEPTKPRGVLRFVDSGRIVFAHKVLHPGTKPNPFLSQALKQVNSDLLR